MAWAKIGATVRWTIFGHFWTTLSPGDGLGDHQVLQGRVSHPLCAASPESTTRPSKKAVTLRAPFWRMTPEASLKVPPVSIISSMMTTSLPRTSPMRLIALALPGASRRLSIRPRVAVRRLALARTQGTPPASGETMASPA